MKLIIFGLKPKFKNCWWTKMNIWYFNFDIVAVASNRLFDLSFRIENDGWILMREKQWQCWGVIVRKFSYQKKNAMICEKLLWPKFSINSSHAHEYECQDWAKNGWHSSTQHRLKCCHLKTWYFFCFLSSIFYFSFLFYCWRSCWKNSVVSRVYIE